MLCVLKCMARKFLMLFWKACKNKSTTSKVFCPKKVRKIKTSISSINWNKSFIGLTWSRLWGTSYIHCILTRVSLKNRKKQGLSLLGCFFLFHVTARNHVKNENIELSSFKVETRKLSSKAWGELTFNGWHSLIVEFY